MPMRNASGSSNSPLSEGFKVFNTSKISFENMKTPVLSRLELDVPFGGFSTISEQ